MSVDDTYDAALRYTRIHPDDAHATLEHLLSDERDRRGYAGSLGGNRGIAADLLDDLGRHEEAGHLRDGTKHVLFHGGTVEPFTREHALRDPMTRHYLETALWSSHGFGTDEHGEQDNHGYPLDDRYGIHDFDTPTLADAYEDVNHFRNTLPGHLRGLVDDEPEQAGHDLWLTRNDHGAGFWARDGDHYYGPDENGDSDWRGQELSDHTHEHFGEYSLFDDGDRVSGQGWRRTKSELPPSA